MTVARTTVRCVQPCMSCVCLSCLCTCQAPQSRRLHPTPVKHQLLLAVYRASHTWQILQGVRGSNMAGCIVLTGRAKDTIVLASGENIEPQPIEVCAH